MLAVEAELSKRNVGMIVFSMGGERSGAHCMGLRVDFLRIRAILVRRRAATRRCRTGRSGEHQPPL